MAQTTQQNILDVTGAQFLLDINAILPALFSASSGATAPTVTVAGQFWFDTSVAPGVPKQRNSTNTAWLTLGGANLSSIAALALVQGDIFYATGAGAVARLPKGTAGQVLTQNAGETAPVWASVFGSSGVFATASGTTVASGAVVPPGVRAVHIHLDQVSLTTNNALSIQLGTSAGLVTSGYSGSTSSGTTDSRSTTAFPVTRSGGGATSGTLTLRRKPAANTWLLGGVLTSPVSGSLPVAAGIVTLPGALDRLAISAAGGTFNGGNFQLEWEY